jgi:cytochrome c5
MRGITRKSVMWIAGTVCCAAVAFSSGQQQMAKGEIIMNDACVACHDMRPIQMQAMDQDAWTKLVESMVAKGAKVKKDDVPVLAEYLAEEHGPLPNGSGKAILLDVCTHCHDLNRVRESQYTRDEWEDLLTHMIGEGAELSDDQFPVLLNYLTRNFKPQ